MNYLSVTNCKIRALQGGKYNIVYNGVQKFPSYTFKPFFDPFCTPFAIKKKKKTCDASVGQNWDYVQIDFLFPF